MYISIWQLDSSSCAGVELKCCGYIRFCGVACTSLTRFVNCSDVVCPSLIIPTCRRSGGSWMSATYLDASHFIFVFYEVLKVLTNLKRRKFSPIYYYYNYRTTTLWDIIFLLHIINAKVNCVRILNGVEIIPRDKRLKNCITSECWTVAPWGGDTMQRSSKESRLKLLLNIILNDKRTCSFMKSKSSFTWK